MPAKTKAKAASTRKGRAATAREASKPREIPLPPDLVEDAKLIEDFAELKQSRIRDMLTQVRELQTENHDEVRSALVRLAARAGVVVTDDEVVGLTEDKAHLRVLSKEAALAEVEAKRGKR